MKDYTVLLLVILIILESVLGKQISFLSEATRPITGEESCSFARTSAADCELFKPVAKRLPYSIDGRAELVIELTDTPRLPLEICVRMYKYKDGDLWISCSDQHGEFLPNLSRIRTFQDKRTSSDATNTVRVTYVDLHEGLYCVKYGLSVSMEDAAAINANYCSIKSVSINVTTAGEIVEPILIKPSEGEGEMKYIVFALIGIILAVIIVIVVVIARLRCSEPDTSEYSENECKVPLEEAIRDLPEVRVYVLCFHEDDQFSELVSYLSTFFKDCCRCRVILDKNLLARIHADQLSYVQEQLRADQKFVIINSPGIYEQYQSLITKQLQKEPDYDCLNQTSLLLLSAIASNPRRVTDYTNIFMTRFSFTERKYQLENIVPNKLLTVPDHLLLLVCYLHGINSSHFDTSTIQDSWENMWQYRQLLQAIDVYQIDRNLTKSNGHPQV